MGERPHYSKFRNSSVDQVLPKNFPQWEIEMNSWGRLLLDSVEKFSEILAIGLGLDRTSFTSKTTSAPHLLAPTARYENQFSFVRDGFSDLSRYGSLGTVLAGFHYDLNLLTIHGKSKFPGLHAWKKDGTKIQISVPDGCLLVQAGKQMEWLTGGAVKAGFADESYLFI